MLIWIIFPWCSVWLAAASWSPAWAMWWKKPQTRIPHWMVKPVKRKLNPSEEKPYRLRKVIKKPKPTTIITCVSLLSSLPSEAKNNYHLIERKNIGISAEEDLSNCSWNHGYILVSSSSDKFSLSYSVKIPKRMMKAICAISITNANWIELSAWLNIVLIGF